MRKRGKIKRKGNFPGIILFMCGFLIGTITPNIFWKLKWQQKTMASMYLLSIFANKDISGFDYLKEILRIRGSYYILCILCGFSVFGAPLAVISMLFLGAELGALLSISILEFGFSGGMIGLGLLFPQYFIYIPVLIVIMNLVYGQSLDVWKNRGLYPEKAGKYSVQAMIGALIYLCGIAMECWCNPWIVEKVIGMIKIF